MNETRLIDIINGNARYNLLKKYVSTLTIGDVTGVTISVLRELLYAYDPKFLIRDFSKRDVPTEKYKQQLDNQLNDFIEEHLKDIVSRPKKCEMNHGMYWGKEERAPKPTHVRCLMWVCDECADHGKHICNGCGMEVCDECGGYSRSENYDDNENDLGDIYTCFYCDH